MTSINRHYNTHTHTRTHHYKQTNTSLNVSSRYLNTTTHTHTHKRVQANIYIHTPADRRTDERTDSQFRYSELTHSQLVLFNIFSVSCSFFAEINCKYTAWIEKKTEPKFAKRKNSRELNFVVYLLVCCRYIFFSFFYIILFNV